MKTTERLMLENYLAFLGSHRGSIKASADTLFLECERPEFSYAFLGPKSKAKELPAHIRTVQHFPWSGCTVDDLAHAGFAPQMSLSFMLLEEPQANWRLRNDMSVGRVTSQAEMDIFSRVQCRGFLESDEGFNDWHPWLKAANDRNLHNPLQNFYVGSVKGEPVGTTLTVESEACVGLYAVATLAQYRKQGVSTTVMHRAVHDATERGAGFITLQVNKDSYVEDFYRHLGFKTLFNAGIFRRNTNTGGK